MNRVGLKDYLLNHADDNDLLDCAKAWDAANENGYVHLEGVGEEASSRMFVTTSTTSSIGSCMPTEAISRTSARRLSG